MERKFIGLLLVALATASLKPASASLVVTEILNNPARVSDARGEWFELLNFGGSPVDLVDWTIADLDTDVHTVTGHLVVEPGEYLVLGRNGSVDLNGGVTLDYVYGSDIALGNGADELLLRDASGTLVDFVSWDGGPLFPDPVGASMALLHPALDNALGRNWQTSVAATAFGLGDLGSPGIANFPAVSVAAPPTGALLMYGLGIIALRRRRRAV